MQVKLISKALIAVLFLGVGSSASVYADTDAASSGTPATTSDPAASRRADVDRYLASKGMWQDPSSKLIWARCSLGQEWTGRECTGTAVRLNWKDAKKAAHESQFADKNDWRLPSFYELKNLKLGDATNPESAGYAWFYKPDADDNYGWYWSSTPYSYFAGDWVWAMDMDIGKSDYINKNRQAHVVLVRQGQ